MRKLLLLTPLLALWLASCDHEEKPVTDKKIQFSFTDASIQSGGRIAVTSDPQSVMVTLQDEEGTLVAERMELTLYKFGNDFLSIPLTLKASGASVYQLTEFFVIGSDNQVTHVTPKEGSSLAHLVADPLDIEFKVEVDKITTVTPEVIAVNENTSATDYGYGQFGFKVINTIDVVFSSFIKSVSNFELANANLRIEGLNEGVTVWTYETSLEPKANTLTIREATNYKITATKSGYKTWTSTQPLKNNDKVEILFEKDSEWEFETIWNKHFGGSSNDSPSRAISTRDGGVLMLNRSISNDHDLNGSYGQYDVWVVKLNSSGAIEWSRSYGDSGTDTPFSITEFPDGSGYLITGESFGSDLLVKGWIMKIDMQGNTLWKKSTEESVYNESVIAVTGVNNFFLAGRKLISKTTIPFSYAVTFCQIDENGETVWEKLNPKLTLTPRRLLKDENSYIMTHLSSIIKMNARGEIEWEKTPPLSSLGFTMVTTLLPDGYSVIANENFIHTFPNGIGKVNHNTVFIKLDKNGEVVQKKATMISPKQSEVVRAVVRNNSGNYIIVGDVYEDNESAQTSTNDAWIMEMTPEGEVIGERFLRGSLTTSNSWPKVYNYFQSIIPLGDEFVIIGNTSDNGGDIPGNYGDGDIWAMKVKF